MKVIYKVPVIDAIMSEIYKASELNKVIDKIVISKEESIRLADELRQLGITLLKSDKVFVLYGVTIQVEGSKE